MYKLFPLNNVIRFLDEMHIPFCVDNTDYQRFKTDILEGAELQDADGNVMSADAAKEFVRGLP
jgi:hypothetical protein